METEGGSRGCVESMGVPIVVVHCSSPLPSLLILGDASSSDRGCVWVFELEGRSGRERERRRTKRMGPDCQTTEIPEDDGVRYGSSERGPMWSLQQYCLDARIALPQAG